MCGGRDEHRLAEQHNLKDLEDHPDARTSTMMASGVGHDGRPDDARFRGNLIPYSTFPAEKRAWIIQITASIAPTSRKTEEGSGTVVAVMSIVPPVNVVIGISIPFGSERFVTPKLIPTPSVGELAEVVRRT